MNSISFAAFDEWLSRQPELIQEHAFFDEADAFEDIGVQFHTGDWTGEVLTAAPVTVIDGNVSVGKISWDYDLGLLLITGNLHCEHIGRLGIDLVVGGKLIAKTLCLNTLNDHALIVGGDIRSDYLAEFGCYVKAQGQIICPKVLSLMNDIVAGWRARRADRRPAWRSRCAGADPRSAHSRWLFRRRQVQRAGSRWAFAVQSLSAGVGVVSMSGLLVWSMAGLPPVFSDVCLNTRLD